MSNIRTFSNGITTETGISTFNGTLVMVGAGIQMDNGQAVSMKNSSSTLRTVLNMQSDNLEIGKTVDGAISFYTNIGTLRMSIGGTGDVGIGTASPSSIFDVRTTTGATVISGRSTNSAIGTEPGYFEMRSPNASGHERIWSQIKSIVKDPTEGTENSDLVFSNQLVGGLQEIMRIHESKLGIGTSTPSEALDVVGNINSSGTISGTIDGGTF